MGAVIAGGVCPSALLLGAVCVLEEAPFGCTAVVASGVVSTSTFVGVSAACSKDPPPAGCLISCVVSGDGVAIAAVSCFA